MSFEHIPIDEQLNLIQLQPDQAEKLFELTDNNRDYLGEFLPWAPEVKEIKDSRVHIEETIVNRESNTTYTYGIEYEGEIVGDISLRNMNSASRPPEIGYWIAANYAGKGLTTRAVQALTNLGIETLQLSKIIIRANPDNLASNRVAEKAGYRLVDHEVENGENLNVWSLTNHTLL